jgi:hypothetical protein
MSIIARALQKAQKERAEKLRKQEAELRETRESVAARIASRRSDGESGYSARDNLSGEAITEMTTDPEPLQETSDVPVPKKRPFLLHIITGLTLFLVVVAAGSFLMLYPLFETARTAPPPPAPKPAKKAVIEHKTAPAKPAMAAAPVQAPTKADVALRQEASIPAPSTGPEKKSAEQQRVSYGTNAPSNLPVVSGIMYSPGTSSAILNGTLVAEGDIVDGYTLRKINISTVIVGYGKEEYELRLRP